MSEKVEAGDTVRFSFVGKFEDGSIFDTSDEPISVEIGTGKLIKGLDKEIMGMSEGEEKRIRVSPEEGYGLENPNLVGVIPSEVFRKNNIEPEVGMILKTPQGNCHITAVSVDEVEVNFNHPLAGKTLIFDIKIEGIVKR
jgi:FKBP-type peptidyl-prolyl cis-trans isomerase 2